jgi:hypothetical protein
MPRIDDYETKLLDEISTLKHNLKLEFDRGYSSGYAQRYVDMQHAGLNKIMHKAEEYEKLFCNFGGHENYVLCPVCGLYKNRALEGEEVKTMTDTVATKIEAVRLATLIMCQSATAGKGEQKPTQSEVLDFAKTIHQWMLS